MHIAVPFTELLQQLWCPSNFVALEPLGAIFIRRRHEKCPRENRSLNLPIIHVRMWRITSCRKLWRRFTGSRSLPGSYMTLWDESEQSLKRVVCVCISVLCTCVCVFVLLRGLYQQHNVNASRNAEAHNDFTAHRWAVQLCTLLLIAKRLIIEVNKRENTVTL